MSASTLSPHEIPSADALDASVCLARLREQMFAQIEVPQVAHYHLLRQIGGGGMGLVFAAWDPTLDRVIAIKVLRDGWGPGSGSPLRREAVALARLRHPNVVSVFEIGDHEGQVYLAMEYVEGVTVREWGREWSAQNRRDLRSLIDVFLQAARGLAAAHAAELVHRDVKPENMMIDADGRVRLMDFGLARREAKDEEGATLSSSSPEESSDTDHGIGVCGTPAYMAPEQFHGTTPGPSADQFALCACLYEVLYGRQVRPARMAAAAAVADDPVAIPADRRVPRALQAILRRGLAIDPAARWPSMTALADELARLRRSRLNRWVLAGSAVVAATGVFAGLAVASRHDSTCSGSVLQMEGVWDETRAQTMRATVGRADAPFVVEAWRALATELDQYRADWVDAHREACEAAQVRREISVAQMDLRMACLRDRRRHLAALVDVVHDGGLEALAGAEEAVAFLPSIASCRDDDYVDRQGYDSGDAEVATRVGDLVARSTTLLASGDLEEARQVAVEAVAEAEKNGDRVTVARAHLALGESQARVRESQEAHESLIRAYELARRAQLSEVATDAAIALARLSGLDLSRYDEAHWWSRLAELESAEHPEPRQLARLELVAAGLLHLVGRGDEAITRGEAAVMRLRDAVGASDRAFLSGQLELGLLHVQNGGLDPGAELIEDAARTLEAALGSEHPSNARSYQLRSLVARLRGDMATAIRHAQRAVSLAEGAVGTDHTSLWSTLESLANSLSQGGKLDEAVEVLERAMKLHRPHPLDGLPLARLHGRLGEVLAEADPERSLEAYERAYEISRSTVGEQHRDTVLFLVGKGAALGALGRTDEATEAVGIGLIMGQAVLGMRHPSVGSIHHDLAREYERQGNHAKALHHNREALDIVQSCHGRDAYPMLAAHGNVCANLVHLERPAEALEHCHRALEISAASEGDSTRMRADAHNNLGVALLLLDRLEEATQAFEVARDTWATAVGERSFEVSIALANLGDVMERAGDCVAGAELYREALAIRERRFGSDHPALNVPREGIARCEQQRSTRTTR